MKMLTVHQPTEADREFFRWRSVASCELLVVPGICPWRERTTMVTVRDLEVSEDDLIGACRASLYGSGHSDETFGEPIEALALEVAHDAIEAASGYALGTLLRLVQKADDEGNCCYVLDELDELVESKS